ncbi:MAG: GNAT family N-acetyltransferase [Chloroflexi bacterium]|nr:GNAT family N-acetyltransferase [Chloroflexota bacterium]MDA1147006.1 GNAT family N-acetyltransferase [Chloroflexota bacterium]
MTREVRPAILRTERLLLRPHLESDADDIYAYARLEEWSRYHLPIIPYPYSRDDADTFIAAMLAADWATDANWAVVLDERVIGGVSLRLEASEQQAELGYSLAPAHWNRGFTTEAARAVLDYAFFVLALDEVVARADARNIGSWRVMEKLGMARTAVIEGGRIDRSRAAVDEVHYAISRSAWLG